MEYYVDLELICVVLCSLAYKHWEHFNQSWERENLDSAISHSRIALGLCPEGDPSRSDISSNLGTSLHVRFEQYGRIGDLEEAIKCHRTALQLRPVVHPDRSAPLDNLANSLVTRFQQHGQTADLDEAIEYHRAALQLRPDGHPNRSASLNNLAVSLKTRFAQYGRTADLKDVIEMNRAALQLLTEGHPDRSKCLNNLAISLSTRFEQHGQTADLNEAIEYYRAALQLLSDGHPNRSMSLNNLASSLETRFKHHGRAADLDKAIELNRAALRLRPDSHPDRSASLSNLASTLSMRFGQYGQTADLDEAIKLNCAALRLLSTGHPDRSVSLSNLANSLKTRFEQYGQTADLDEAIELNRAALQLLSDGHPNRSGYLSDLASSLSTRFERDGQTADLDEVIELNRAALQLRPDGHPNRSASLSNLASSLETQFEQHGQTADLDEAIELNRAALQLRPDGHPDRSASLSNLASSLYTRFKQCGQTADLDEDVELNRAALQLRPDGDPFRSASLNNLANSLLTRFELYGQTADLYEAIDHHRAALQLRPDGHPDRSASLSGLALSLLSQYKKSGLIDKFEECIQLLQFGTEHPFSSLVIRLEIASAWAHLAHSHAHYTATSAYKAAMLLLQRTLIISPTLHAQHDFLRGRPDFRTLALGAVAYAVEGNRLEEAIEILDQGRCLLWSQMRGFRTPLDRLAEANVELADKFSDVSRQLENLATSSSELQPDPSTAGSALFTVDVRREQMLSEEKLRVKRQLSNKQEDLIQEIRKIPGFENFLAATPFRVLQEAASEGPVIVVNLSQYRSDALIVLSREDLPVVCISLDGEFCDDSVDLCNELVRIREQFKVFSPEYDEALCRAMKMLWDRVVSKVVKKFEELGIPKGARIWWCPTYGLSALPFHAAGPFEGADGMFKYLLDDYVSSYTPSLGALINSRIRKNESKPKMLIVGDTKSLNYTRSEVLAVRNNTRSYVSPPQIFLDGKALRSAVIGGLQDATWIHFACHGHLGSLDCSFQLSDGELTLLDIIRADLPNAEFAFLSACHTAEWGLSVSPDEVLHLAAAVQFCGFRSVIGTMWEMYDPDGPLLAREVYSYMGEYEDGEVIHKRSAAALRQAVLALRRQEGVTTERWVNLVHIGA